jgi:hypothetical protein
MFVESSLIVIVSMRGHWWRIENNAMKDSSNGIVISFRVGACHVRSNSEHGMIAESVILATSSTGKCIS